MFQKQLNNTAKAICLTVCPSFKVQKQSWNSRSCSCIQTSNSRPASSLLLQCNNTQSHSSNAGESSPDANSAVLVKARTIWHQCHLVVGCSPLRKELPLSSFQHGASECEWLAQLVTPVFITWLILSDITKPPCTLGRHGEFKHFKCKLKKSGIDD